jgi:hypothetical protein
MLGPSLLYGTRDVQGARKIPSVVKDPFNILKYMNHTTIFASREAGSISYGTTISFHSCQSLRDQSKGNVLLLFFVILIVGSPNQHAWWWQVKRERMDIYQVCSERSFSAL